MSGANTYRSLISMRSTLMADSSGTESIRRSRSSCCSLSEIQRTRFIRCEENPAILLRLRFDGMIAATSSSIFLLVWKSSQQVIDHLLRGFLHETRSIYLVVISGGRRRRLRRLKGGGVRL
ncbi:hypothetical protein ABFX02_08G155300 [Erythranthe guttata]